MDTLDPCCEILTNQNVMEFLKSNSINSSKKPTNLATISYETITYLESTPAQTTTSGSITIFENQCKEREIKFSRIEFVQLVNLLPENETELNLIIDNLEERFSEEQRNDIINLLKVTRVTTSKSETVPRKKLKI